MVCLGHGGPSIWPRSLSNGVSRCLDSEISPPYPESWVRGYLRKLFPKVMSSLPGCEIIELNMQVDHIHMLMVIPPKYAVSAVIGQMKQYTASRIEGKVWVVGKSVLEGAGSLVARIFCVHGWTG